MEARYNRYIFNIDTVPSPKSILVAIPMKLYRIQTYKFDNGLNFFQKAVLRFKAKPGITNQKISDMLGLDEKLVLLVETELRSKQLLDETGSYTAAAREFVGDIDNIVIDKTQTQLGYVLQYADKDELYPFYLTTIGSEPNMDEKGRIVIGTKGDGTEKNKAAYDLSYMIDTNVVLPAPDEYEILDTIKNTRQKSIEDESDIKLESSLSLRFFQEKPEPQLVLVYTYVYLPKSENTQLFDSDWQVLDPFFPDYNSAHLKFYIESYNDRMFKELVESTFSNVETVMHERFRQYQIIKEQEIQNLIDKEYCVGYDFLPRPIKEKIHSLSSAYIDVLQSKYGSIDYIHSFLNTVQKTLESVLIYDKEVLRPEVYKQLSNEYGEQKSMSKADIDMIRNIRYHDVRDSVYDYKNPFALIVKDRFVKLSNSVNPTNTYSLKHYVFCMVLTSWYDKGSKIFNAFKGHVDTIIDLANLRNSDVAHGSLANNKHIKKEEVEKYYNTYKTIINNLINSNYGEK